MLRKVRITGLTDVIPELAMSTIRPLALSSKGVGEELRVALIPSDAMANSILDSAVSVGISLIATGSGIKAFAAVALLLRPYPNGIAYVPLVPNR